MSNPTRPTPVTQVCPVAGVVFRLGEEWRSPKGFLYLVTKINPATGQVVLRKGGDGQGPTQFRSQGQVWGWTLIAAAKPSP